MRTKRTLVLDADDGLFVRWLCDNLNANGWNYSDVSKKIGVTRQAINSLVTQHRKPQKMMIIALCWAFGSKDDPEDIWRLIQEDWG